MYVIARNNSILDLLEGNIVNLLLVKHVAKTWPSPPWKIP